MTTIENEIKAREELYNLANLFLTEEEKAMPKYQALKSLLERCLKREITIKSNPELDKIIDAITNDGYTFKQAIVVYLGNDYLNAPDNSELYNELFDAALQREKEFNYSLRKSITEQQKQDYQLEIIEEFCKQNNLNFDNFIQEIQEKITKPIESYSMEAKHLLAYKIAIEVINEIQADNNEPQIKTQKIYKTKPFLFTFRGRTYLINESCGVIKLKEFIDPTKELYNYAEIFADFVQNNYPNKWAEIIEYTKNLKQIDNKNTAKQIVIDFIKDNSTESVIDDLKKQKETQKNITNPIKRINEITRITNTMHILAIFWETVANLFNKELSWEELARTSINEFIKTTLLKHYNEIDA